MNNFAAVRNEWDNWCGIISPKVYDLYQFKHVLPTLLDKRHEVVSYKQELELELIDIKARLKRNKRNELDIGDDKVLCDNLFKQISFSRDCLYQVDEMIKKIMARLKIEEYKRKQH